MKKSISIYVTFSTKSEALKVAKALVEEKLIACANIVDHATSVYRWDDKIMEEGEVVLFAKTRSSLFKKVEAKIKSLHSYSVPCILALTIEAGSKPYLDWIEKETK